MNRRCVLATAFGIVLACLFVPTGADEPGSPGQLLVRDAWARATPPGSDVAAVYLSIQGGTERDRLLGATTATATTTQIHAVTEAKGMARMRQVGEVEVPAGSTVVFAPQGLHLMLMGLAQPLVAGESFEITLRFATAGTRVVRVHIVGADSTPPAH